MLRKTSVATRLAILTATLLTSLVVGSVLSTRALDTTQASLRSVYVDRAVPAVSLGRMLDQLHRVRYALFMVATSMDDAEVAGYAREIREADKEVDRLWQTASTSQLSADAKPLVAALEGRLSQYRETRDRALRVIEAGHSEEALPLLKGEGKIKLDALRDGTAALIAVEEKDAKTEYDNADHHASSTQREAMFLALGAGLVAIALSFWLIQSVTRPLGAVRSVLMQARQKGDLSGRAPIEFEDEVGDTATALNGLLIELDGLVRDIAVVTTAAAEGQFHKRITVPATGELETVKTNINRFLGELETVLNEVEAVMSTLADGDMRGRVNAPARGQLGTIKTNINKSLSELSSSFQRVAQTIRQVASATQEASAAVGQVSDGAQHQLEALKHVAVGMQQTSQAVAHVSNNARESSAKAREATVLVKEGAASVDGVVEVVTRIREQSEEVTRITDLISQIANQTNMLSLNAAIEAARAGEHGKGFAVVAEQVGRLAESSGKSVKEIVSLLGRAAKETHRGVEVATTVRKSIDSIANRVRETDRMAETIATAMEQQQAAIAEINASVSDLARIGQTNAAASEEITSTMVELARLAKQTRDEIERFKTS